MLLQCAIVHSRNRDYEGMRMDTAQVTATPNGVVQWEGKSSKELLESLFGLADLLKRFTLVHFGGQRFHDAHSDGVLLLDWLKATGADAVTVQKEVCQFVDTLRDNSVICEPGAVWLYGELGFGPRMDFTTVSGPGSDKPDKD